MYLADQNVKAEQDNAKCRRNIVASLKESMSKYETTITKYNSWKKLCQMIYIEYYIKTNMVEVI